MSRNSVILSLQASYSLPVCIDERSFDQNKDVIDMVHAKELLKIGEAELEKNRHPQPMKFPNSKGGVGFERDTISPDWLLDTWHPAERAQYPEYFKLREQRKKEFIEQWEKKYGKPEPAH